MFVIPQSQVLVLGMGGFGRQLGELLRMERGYLPLFLDDNAAEAAGPLADYIDPTLRSSCVAAYVGLGDSALRLQWLKKLSAAGYNTPRFFHSSAVVCTSAQVGQGTVILPHAFVGASATIGVGCIINAGAIVDHDAVLEDGVHVAPGGIVKAGARVSAGSKVASGEVVASPWDAPANH